MRRQQDGDEKTQNDEKACHGEEMGGQSFGWLDDSAHGHSRDHIPVESLEIAQTVQEGSTVFACRFAFQHIAATHSRKHVLRNTVERERTPL